MTLPILSRSEWGARPPKRTATISDRSGGIVVHYTAVDSSTVDAHWPDCYSRWQRHQNYHMDVRGWNDLAYNFGMCIHGFIFEGRGWDARNGANWTDEDDPAGPGLDENDRTLSICVDVGGNDTFDEAVVVNLNGLIAEAVTAQGWASRLRGHYQVSLTGTECPGDTIKKMLRDGTIHPFLANQPSTSLRSPVKLLGSPTVTLLQMQDWARSRGATQLFVELAAYAWMESFKLGIDPAVVYAIMAHETAFGRFGGVLDASFNNYGGIKTADGGSDSDPNAHHRFNSPHLGVLAVVQHVAGYAGLKLHEHQIVDPRFALLANKRIKSIPSDEWTWASSEHDSKVASFVHEMRR